LVCETRCASICINCDERLFCFRLFDTPTAIGFAFTWLWFSGSILMVSALSGRIFPVFDTPMERWISNGSVLHCALRVARLRVLV